MPHALHTDNDHKDYYIQKLRGKCKSRKRISFEVMCHNDAHIALLSGDSVGAPMIEVFIGGWQNTKSAIRLNQTKPDKISVETPGICRGEEFRKFWIRFKDNDIVVGAADNAEPFMRWYNNEAPFKVKYIGVTTGWGSDGHWRLAEEGESSDSD